MNRLKELIHNVSLQFICEGLIFDVTQSNVTSVWLRKDSEMCVCLYLLSSWCGSDGQLRFWSVSERLGERCSCSCLQSWRETHIQSLYTVTPRHWRNTEAQDHSSHTYSFREYFSQQNKTLSHDKCHGFYMSGHFYYTFMVLNQLWKRAAQAK